MSRSRSSVTSSSHDRLEPRLVKAAASDALEDLRDVVATARENGQLTDGFLRVGLMRACERGRFNAAQYLLSLGAVPDLFSAPGNANANANANQNASASANAQGGGGGGGGRVTASPLLKAVERNHVRIAQVLLDYGASTEIGDRKGRTAIMTAAWKNHFHILQVLIARGADVNARDLRQRNVLHNLAADKMCDWGEDVIRLLLETVCEVDARDELGRSPLHWACATGKESIISLLLRHGADVNARSDGGWTPLHNACDRGSESIARRLLAAGAKINSQLLNGVSPLHLAAQGGHREVVE
ncbi:hypothetical protein ASPVEDRAFT_158864, partial [Aspergillus versicolor CBS 583.65]